MSEKIKLYVNGVQMMLRNKGEHYTAYCRNDAPYFKPGAGSMLTEIEVSRSQIPALSESTDMSNYLMVMVYPSSQTLPKITSLKEDNDLIGAGNKPNYIVVSESIGAPFISAEMAIKWHNTLLQQGVQTTILDLTEYDWDANPANFKFHNISTPEGMDEVGKEIAVRNQTVIN